MPSLALSVNKGTLKTFDHPGDSGKGDYERLVNKFGTRRSNVQFWSIFDAINSIHISSNPARAGAFDLTRYSLDAK